MGCTVPPRVMPIVLLDQSWTTMEEPVAMFRITSVCVGFFRSAMIQK